MALDPYASCPCGSGKKFKWCCQPIHADISKAFSQDAEGQHEAALKAMDAIAAAHPGNPEVWGRRAQLLFQLDKADEAEKSLDKAFELNPNYPFGYLLQGNFRKYEGEIAGALVLFRKAVNLYDPEAKSVLGQLQAMIADCELKLNRPVAARAAIQLAIRLVPTIEDYRQALEQIFGDQSALPLSARKEYTFRALPAQALPERKASWDRALGAAATGKLADATAAFAQLVKADESDACAWFNLGLAHAWEGNHPAALEALDRSVLLESDDVRIAEAGALCEVLRCGQGMEDQSDHVSHFAVMGLQDPQGFVNILGELEKERRLFGVQVRKEEGVLSAMVLEKVPALTPEMAASASPKLAANLMMAGPVVRLWNLDKSTLDRVIAEIRERAGAAIGAIEQARGPAHFTDITGEWLVIPTATSEEESRRKLEEGCARFLEETWLHRPLIALNRIAPIDAAGHADLRKKLLGVVQFLEECGALAGIPYDFQRLRGKLGLMAGQAASADKPLDLAARGAAELAALALDSLSDAQAELAYQTAMKLDARELAGKFARDLVARPTARPDRYPWYAHLVQLALAEGQLDAALELLAAGEQADAQHNEGKRQSDFELRRGQVLARKGDIDEAQAVFDRLIERVPAESRLRGAAAETMLAAKQPARALRFAQDGLALARKQNNRDSEEHFKELVAAAQR
ncbi:MAG: tetratricopeptide repeat protein [Planctomycetes bacterium]|nr:tetratricopeptide repeat protein [Planctomycetota bacterium]